MNPFVGTWVANLEKSQRHVNHQFQSATLTFGETADGVAMTHAGVNMSGKHESGTTVLHPDGVERPASPQAPGVMAVTTYQARTSSRRRRAPMAGRSAARRTRSLAMASS
jgi:hypothetical protein